jgi:hypothetical protein
MNRICPLSVVLLAVVALPARAQLGPEIGYVHPAGAAAGSTVEVKIGGYDWTSDTQIFVHDPRVKLEIIGPPSPVLVPAPPYWFGAKGRGYAWPLPREFPARLTIAADVPPGLVRFQVANANGASPPGFVHVGSAADIVEQAGDTAALSSPQVLSALPVVVSGQVQLIEEIDRYSFVAPRTEPITIELFARRFGSMLHAAVKIHDAQGKLVFDRADTEGRDFADSFLAQAGTEYTVSLHDLDYAGDRSYVYRLALTPGPRVVAAYPAAGKRGETQQVEFLGLGIATGANRWESFTASLAFPATPGRTFDYALTTPTGVARPFALQLSDLAELIRPADAGTFSLPQLPSAVTSSIATRFGSHSYQLTLEKDQRWQIAAQAVALGSPLDLDLSLLGPDGKELAYSDDSPESTDPLLNVAVAAAGLHTVVVGDRSGKSGGREAPYRLVVKAPAEDFTLTAPTQAAVPLGGTVKLPVKVVREGGFAGAIDLTLQGLPSGVTAPARLQFPAGANELAIDLTAASDAAASAALVQVSATATVGGQSVSRTAGPTLVATTLKPRIKITPEGLDDVRKVHRGSTFLAPLLIERLEGYQGEITLEMTAKQQRHRQGLASGEFVVPADAQRVEYPIFVPEWMETTKTSRMIVNGAVRVKDPQGNERTLLQRQELRIGILPEGALMKLSYAGPPLQAAPGTEVCVPLALSRAAGFSESAQVEWVPSAQLAEKISAEPRPFSASTSQEELVLKLAADPQLVGEHTLVFRATSLKQGRWPVVAEVKVELMVKPTLPSATAAR